MKKLFLLALIVGAVLVVRKIQADRAEWQGLTESEARAKMSDKLEPKLAGKLDGEQIDALATSIVNVMLAKGVVVADPA